MNERAYFAAYIILNEYNFLDHLYIYIYIHIYIFILRVFCNMLRDVEYEAKWWLRESVDC